jgi:ribosomal protein L10
MAEAAKNKEKKSSFIKKIYEKLSTSKSIILVSLPHVSSNQVQ